MNNYFLIKKLVQAFLYRKTSSCYLDYNLLEHSRVLYYGYIQLLSCSDKSEINEFSQMIVMSSSVRSSHVYLKHGSHGPGKLLEKLLGP